MDFFLALMLLFVYWNYFLIDQTASYEKDKNFYTEPGYDFDILILGLR